MRPEFTSKDAFLLDAGTCEKLNVRIQFETETGKPLSVYFSDPDRDQMVSVPADLWQRVVAAVERAWEF